MHYKIKFRRKGRYICSDINLSAWNKKQFKIYADRIV